MRDHGFDHVEHDRLRLSDRQPSDGVAVKADLDERACARRAERLLRAALNDAEDRPARLFAERSLRALRPAQGEAHRALGLLGRARQLHAFVELHLDIRSEQALDLHRALGRQFVQRPIDMRLESDALLAELSELRQTHHLEAARSR